MTGPLQGLNVLDFTHGVAGPYATMILGDLGCEVIKVEKPGRGEASRFMNVAENYATEIPHVGGDYYLAINRNKRAITIDLKAPEGRRICLELARWADVAVQSFRPGLMEKLGLGYEDLRAVNPRIIYANLTGYGRTGPLADRPGMDVAVQARAGIMSITGPVGSTEAVRPGVSLSDFGGGAFLAMGIMGALLHRERTGEGQEVDVSLLGATTSMLSNYSVAVLDGGVELGPMGSGHPQIVPYQAFPTSDGAIVIATGTNKSYRQLCAALGREDLGEDPRFATNPERVRHREILVPLIAEVTRTKPTGDWERILTEAQLPCAPVNTIKQAFSEPQLVEIGMLREMEHPRVGTIHVTGIPFSYSRSPGDLRRYPPMLGEHTAEVLKEIVGMDPAEIGALQEARIV